MKKISTICLLILSLTLVIILPVHATEFGLIEDRVGLLTEQEYAELNDLALQITEQHQCEVSIAIVKDIGTEDVIDFAKRVYKENDYGLGDDKSGLLLLLSMADRDYALVARGYGNTAFTDHGKDVLLERYLLPSLGEDKYYEGFLSYLNQTAAFLEMAESGTPFDVDTDEENDEGSFLITLAIVFLFPLLIAGVVTYVFAAQMKTAVSERSAANYMPGEGVNLTRKTDTFLYKTETRTTIEKKSGGTSIDSDGSSSKSGKF